MPRPRKQMPDYRYHTASGQAVVTLDGVDFYLGKHNTPKSRAKYLEFIAEYQAKGLKAPSKKRHLEDQPITVRCVTAE